MRFRTGFVLGGVIGYLVGRELARREQEDERPLSVRQAMARHPSSRIAEQGRRLAERAGSRSLSAIQRARATLQQRMDHPDLDDLSLN